MLHDPLSVWEEITGLQQLTMGEGSMLDWIKKSYSGDTAASSLVSPDNIPQHVAIIMDGNGRWARQRGLPRIAGHHTGMKTVKNITLAANELGIRILTMYAFSTENWKRPKDEVDYLMRLPQEFLSIELDELIANNVQVRMMGWPAGLPAHTIHAVETAVEKTKHNTGMILNFALNYGSRREIIEAVKKIAEDVKAGKLQPEELEDHHISDQLLSSDLPDPDLLIRTSGEIRISNFMLWQCAYTEFVFTDVYWPAFTKEHFHEAIHTYQQRIRRYGGLQK